MNAKFETLQDRLVKEMRLAGIDNLATASPTLVPGKISFYSFTV
jgi:hypothetical protein